MLEYSEFPSVLVTGATGFVGQALRANLCELEVSKIVCTTRKKLISDLKNLLFFQCGDANDWLDVLTGCEVVVHVAERLHVMQETTTNPLAEFLCVNAIYLKPGLSSCNSRGDALCVC
jgi:nucleoside-diphosphate-sugar epimerase